MIDCPPGVAEGKCDQTAVCSGGEAWSPGPTSVLCPHSPGLSGVTQGGPTCRPTYNGSLEGPVHSKQLMRHLGCRRFRAGLRRCGGSQNSALPEGVHPGGLSERPEDGVCLRWGRREWPLNVPCFYTGNSKPGSPKTAFTWPRKAPTSSLLSPLPLALPSPLWSLCGGASASPPLHRGSMVVHAGCCLLLDFVSSRAGAEPFSQDPRPLCPCQQKDTPRRLPAQKSPHIRGFAHRCLGPSLLPGCRSLGRYRG